VIRGIDPPEVEGYQWDGWKLIMIAKLNSNGTFHSRKWSCVWRPDIGSSLYARNDWMRAGGVGGLAWLQTGAVQSYSYGTGSGEVHVPLADHMGNVRHYYQFKASGKTVTGQLVASYEYDAFGREVRAWGTNTPATSQPPGLPANRPWADLLPFHYSSKLRDVDSGFNYYGYRFYDPGAGRWLNRDPIGEAGGVNLYGMVGNDGVGRVDVLGLNELAPEAPGIYLETHTVLFGRHHSKITIIACPNSDMAKDPRFMYNRTAEEGNRYLTIGAGPSGAIPLIRPGELISSANRDRDLNRTINTFSQLIMAFDCCLCCDNSKGESLAYKLIEGERKYNCRADYDFFPEGNLDAYNSNSFISGLLNHAGLGTTPAPTTLTPGYATPLPGKYFLP
jgi:RHS repeat-associated protein